ncbi:MAG: DUF4097 family beta strand repeat-containing protein [Ktedonobacteraceae bacterium]
MRFSNSNADPYGGNPNPSGNSGMLSMRQQRRRGRLRGCLGCLTPMLALLIIGALISTFLGLSLTGGPTVIQVGSHPTLIVESEGFTESVLNKPVIHIHAGGQNGQIVIQPHRLLGIPFGFPEVYQESSDHQTVIYNYDSSSDASGTFDITVPAQTNLKVDTNSWALQVEGITGQMVLTTNSGTLTVKNCHLLGSSLLSSNSGELHITQDQLSGSVVLDDNSAAITFQGSLDPHGTYGFANNKGTITVTLPQNMNVHIDAVTGNGGTLTSHIPQTSVQQSAFGNGFELHADVGATPRAVLSLSTNNGSITINEQGGN